MSKEAPNLVDELLHNYRRDYIEARLADCNIVDLRASLADVTRRIEAIKKNPDSTAGCEDKKIEMKTVGQLLGVKAGLSQAIKERGIVKRLLSSL